MIGFTGFIDYKRAMNTAERENIVKMMVCKDDEYFTTRPVSHGNCTIAITERTLGENKDLSLKTVRDGLIGFSGYGKFKGEKKLCFADEMSDKIASGFIADGPDVFKKLEGSFFCFVVFKSKAYLISDRLGSKNCYYHSSDESLLFSPSVTSLMDSGLIRREKDLDGILQILVSGFFLKNDSLVKHVKRFPMATVMTINPIEEGNVRFEKYWTVPGVWDPQKNMSRETVQEFRELLFQAIGELHDLEEDAVVPLSGGLDSRTIACVLSTKKKIETITYDSRDETKVASRVCDILNGTPQYFSNSSIESEYFHTELTKIIMGQHQHTVANQYFYAPLFARYFKDHPKNRALYDGVYMDILFSAPYTYEQFSEQKYLGLYAGSVQLIDALSSSVDSGFILSRLNPVYDDIMKEAAGHDGLAQSQLAYISGRLRRYVCESYLSRENFCYVFKPGFNYELMDFAFKLDFKIRKGILYTRYLNEDFPKVMAVNYKDSYGNRPKTFFERFEKKYKAMRLKIYSATQGAIRYFPYQADYYFVSQKGMDAFRSLFEEDNYVSELFNDKELKTIFYKTKRKPYYLNLFNRLLMIQQFYRRHQF